MSAPTAGSKVKEAMKEKMDAVLQKVKQGTKILKELREFDALIKSIGECKSKAEEDRIILAELEVLKQRFSDPKLDKSRGREYMVRLLYCEMLGHDASFAYVKALQFASEPNILTKKAAYLCLTQLLDHNSQLVLLLVNTLLSDLKSDNYVIVCSALVVCTKLIGPDLIGAVLPVVTERLRHPKEHVRKKAIIALLRFQQLDPKNEGPLMGMDLDKNFRTMLCDKDPSVMSAALCALHDCISRDPRPFRNLISSFTSILKQVAEHRLPKTYDYHRFPAPFIQIKLLRILAMLGAGDRASSENMYAVVLQVLRRANGSHTIGNAIIAECVRTITTIYPNPQLLAAAAESIAALLKSTSHNLRYIGIDALAGIVQINPAYAQEHQLAVVDCLEDPDDTLKLKTLTLLHRMTKANNVEVIVERMMSYLRATTDDHIRKDIVRRVSELAERYAPSAAWFLRVMAEVFLLAGEHAEASLAHALMRLVAEQDAQLQATAVSTFMDLLGKRAKLPEVLLQVACWVLGEYGHMASVPVPMVMAQLCTSMAAISASDESKGYLLTALTKLAAYCTPGAGTSGMPPDAQALIKKASTSSSVELQQRAYELQALLSSSKELVSAALPRNSAAYVPASAELDTIRSGSFLDGIVQRALANGAQPYLSLEARASGSSSAGGCGAFSNAHNTKGGPGLRFEAYEAAPHARGTAGASTSSAAGDDPFGDFGGSSSSAAAGSGRTSVSGMQGGVRGGSAGDLAALAGSSGGPALTLKNAGGRKWGPAQFSSGPEPAAPSATAASNVGSALSRSGTQAGPSSSAQQLRANAERDKLAASLFGDTGCRANAGGGSDGTSSSGMVPPRPAAAGVARAGMHGHTRSFGSGASTPTAGAATSTVTALHQPKRSDIDLLMDFDIPPPVPAAASQQQLGGGLGMGSAPVPPVPSTLQPGGLSTVAHGLLDGTFGGVPAPTSMGAGPGMQPNAFGMSLGISGITALGHRNAGLQAGIGPGLGQAQQVSGFDFSLPAGGQGLTSGSHVDGMAVRGSISGTGAMPGSLGTGFPVGMGTSSVLGMQPGAGGYGMAMGSAQTPGMMTGGMGPAAKPPTQRQAQPAADPFRDLLS